MAKVLWGWRWLPQQRTPQSRGLVRTLTVQDVASSVNSVVAQHAGSAKSTGWCCSTASDINILPLISFYGLGSNPFKLYSFKYSNQLLLSPNQVPKDTESTANRRALDTALGQTDQLLCTLEGSTFGSICWAKAAPCSKWGTWVTNTQTGGQQNLHLSFLCACGSHIKQGLYAADPCSSILLTKGHKINPRSCWKELLHCTFHEQSPSPFHSGLLHSCLASACPNFHAPQGPTKKNIIKALCSSNN